MNEICKGNPNPRLNTKTKLGRVMKLTSIPLFIFTTGVYASVHSPNMRIKSDIMIIEKPSIVSTPQQNTRQITGTVIDATGMPIIGANVMVKGTTNGTITDIDGKFTLEVAKDAILQVSYIGYMNQEIPVGNKSVLSISLQEDTQKLDEVVVIGYGTMKKSDITGAISSVSEEKIARQAVANVSTALQGLATGVSVTSSSGSPGSAATIRIRGVGTVNDAEPLFVVDGMPVTDINYLNTSDIQSMEVLKDASASAIYGSRGANGVILITTKKGAAGKTTVTLDAYWGMNKILNNLDLMSGPEWYDYQEQLNTVRSVPINLALVNRNVSTNWMDEITHTAFMHNYSVGISGGKENDYKFNLGLNYINQDGTIKKSNYERFSVRQSTEKTVLKDHLVVGTNASIARSTDASISERNSSNVYDSDYGVVSNAIRLDPVTPAQNADGSYGYSPYIDYYNPLASIMYRDNQREKLAFIGNMYGEWQIIKGLKFKSSFGAEIRRVDNKTFSPVYEVSSSQRNLESSLSKSQTKGHYYTFENTLSYEKTFAEKHSISALVGYTNEWGKQETLSVNARDLIGESDNLHYIDATLDKNKTTENARIILALTAIGKDVTNVDGHDLLAGLNEMSYLSKQGINGAIFTLIALDSHNYTPAGDVTRDKLVQAILDAQISSDGGWSLDGKNADVDMTAMAIQALAAYYKSNSSAKKAVDKGLSWLSSVQQNDGGFTSWGAANSESCAQVIVALTALGIDPTKDSRFIKNGVSVLDALCSFAVNGGGFKHLATETSANGMATEQGFYALVAYYRLLNGQTSLYDMTDVKLEGVKAEEPVDDTDKSDDTADTEVEDTSSGGQVVLWVVIGVVAVGGIAALAVTSKKRHGRDAE